MKYLKIQRKVLFAKKKIECIFNSHQGSSLFNIIWHLNIFICIYNTRKLLKPNYYYYCYGKRWDESFKKNLLTRLIKSNPFLVGTTFTYLYTLNENVINRRNI